MDSRIDPATALILARLHGDELRRRATVHRFAAARRAAADGYSRRARGRPDRVRRRRPGG